MTSYSYTDPLTHETRTLETSTDAQLLNMLRYLHANPSHPSRDNFPQWQDDVYYIGEEVKARQLDTTLTLRVTLPVHTPGARIPFQDVHPTNLVAEQFTEQLTPWVINTATTYTYTTTDNTGGTAP